jgi:hypothetical protein
MAKKKKFYIFINIVLVITILGSTVHLYYGKAKEKKTALKARLDYYNSVIANEQKWLAGLQQSNGALAFRSKNNGTVAIIPYFSCITAIALLQKAPDKAYADVVKGYFDWHFAHLNNAVTDKSGIAGTIYDYSAEVLNGVVRSQNTEQEYDSIDSYAALFLIALWEYYEQTGNVEYLTVHYRQINDVIGAMNATIDETGLSTVKPTLPVKYLMDNTEVYKGLTCAINLLQQVFLPQFKETSEYHNLKQKIAHLQNLKNRQEQAIETLLWNGEEERYETGINNDGTVLEYTGWTDFYPDAVAQLFPVIFEVIDPESERARNLYHTFGEYFKWEELAHYKNGNASFYWGLTAYCGAIMRDEVKVDAYLEYYQKNVPPNYEYPAYNADVAWVVLASAEMARYYELQMTKVDPLGLVKVE